MAAYDKHGRRPNHGQGLEQSGRKPQQGLSRCLQDTVGGSAPVQAEVVDFYDDGDDAIDGGGEHKGDYAEAKDLCDERFADEARQRDDDDFDGEDEVGANGAADFVLFLLFGCLCVICLCRRCLFMAMQQAVQDFFHAFVAKVGAADHEDKRHDSGQEGAEQECDGDDDGFVEQ